MKKLLSTFILIITVYSLDAQKIYIGSNGTINFTSDAPLELIEASTDQLAGIINLDDRSFLFNVPMNTFQGFNSKLQQTHFNENYMESSKYPKATFEGKIIEEIDFTKPGTYSVRGKGTFLVHGVDDSRIIKTEMIIKPNSIEISANFTVFLEDHDISIPSVVNQKIAEEIEVEINIVLKPKN